jgi:hypothetical protein
LSQNVLATFNHRKKFCIALAAWPSGIFSACHRGDWSYVWVVWSNPARVYGIEKSFVFILTMNGLGYTLGDFFTNASGHPASFPSGYNMTEFISHCVNSTEVRRTNTGSTF